MAASENDAEDTERERSEAPKATEPGEAPAGDGGAQTSVAAGAESEQRVADDAPADEVAAETKAKLRLPRRRSAAAAAAAAAADGAEESAAGEPAAEAKPKRRRGAGGSEAAEEPKPRGRRTRARTASKAPGSSSKVSAPAAKGKRPARDYGDNPPMVRAHAKYVRTSARKARLVCDHIRGKSVEEARAILAHASRDVARDWSKLLESAVANAEHNHELIGDELRIAAVKADEGPTLKRFRPRAMGRATKIRKRTSHLSITLTPKDGDS
jgi:ribosomal protein L22